MTQRLNCALNLAQLQAGFDSLEIRAWCHDYYINKSKLFILQCRDGVWYGNEHIVEHRYWNGVLNENLDKNPDTTEVEKMAAAPYHGWSQFSTSLAEKLSRLPPADEIKSQSPLFYGEVYVVEIATKQTYRFYSYCFDLVRANASYNLDSQALRVMEFVKFIEDELEQGYNPILVYLSGTVYDFRTNEPLKNHQVFTCEHWQRNAEPFFEPDNKGTEYTDREGTFTLHTYLDLNNPDFYFAAKGYAEIKFEHPDLSTMQWEDTLDIGPVWVVAYDDESREIVRLPKKYMKEYLKKHPVKGQPVDTMEKYPIAELRILFPRDSVVRRMEFCLYEEIMNVSKLYYGPGKPGGSLGRIYKRAGFCIDLRSEIPLSPATPVLPPEDR